MGYFSLLFPGNFCGRGQDIDGGEQSPDGASPSPPPLEKSLQYVLKAYKNNRYKTMTNKGHTEKRV